MADFFQNGSIATLQNITSRPVEAIEQDLRQFAQFRNMVLLLPALFSEFETPSMPRIIAELQQVDYLSKIVLSLDRADEGQFRMAKKHMAGLPGEVKIVWHDGPRLQQLYRELEQESFRLGDPGKGRSVWMTMGYILADRNTYAIGLHDTDILNYERSLLARLFYPVVHPALDYEFSKGFYARATDRFYGRVTRLFYTPLLRSLMKILGYNQFLDFLDSFRYALSGEFAFIAPLARSIRISPTWGLEVSMLSEVYTKTSINRVAQVELLGTYEHKHQVLDTTQPREGLIRMANEIAKTLFRVLSQDGIVMSGSFFRTLQTTYIQESRFAIEKYNALALINGLQYDRHEEIAATEVFVEALKSAIEEFMADPVGIPLLSAWVRVRAAIPDFHKRLAAAVDEDNA
ncbi:MAG: glycosyl transferase [Deltaproteobacteria bacterium]|nr:glycosyl transferase [Deltaproteobacteria bacterium]